MNIAQKLLSAVLPPPSSGHSPNSNPQNSDRTQDSTFNLNNSCCQFTFSDGRRCRNERAQLCVHHASKRARDSGAEGAPDAALEGLCSNLTTATNINRALAQTFLLLAQGRISQKQAVAFGYLTQLLLQTVAGVRAEYVSAFGYRQWEQKLKSTLALREDENVSPPEPPAAPPADSGYTRSPQDEPDYDSLYSRSLDLLDRKYDTTPEGRSEGKKLALELELMKPPAAASAAPVNLPSPPVAHSKPSPAGPIKKPEAPDYVLPALAAKQAAPPPVRRVSPAHPTPAAPLPEADRELPETKASLWDGRWRPPMPLDPFAPRSTAFERELRGMSNAGWRRWQHRNSRAF